MISFETEAKLLSILKEDIGSGDITSAITPAAECTAQIKTNEACTLAGIEEIAFLFKSAGLTVHTHKKDGEIAKKGQKILEVHGSNRKILSYERVCLNILGRMCGVATMCAKAKTIAQKETIAVTRKTVPGFQSLDKKAAEIAGCWTHRKNLAEMILLKDNHLKFFSGAGAAAQRAKESGKDYEIEVENESDALEVARHSPHIIMLDNFSPENAKKTIKKLRKEGYGGKIELSGGISFSNLKKYTGLGADIISMGALTKTAKIVDFSMDIMTVKK
ncbi:MAG TPA: carboxylating nicotinate-nucleotide diphosphorylase [archaeon]|nr:carboxylating nicotinate-nucleotide diphosphorylase [archaeon]